MKDHFKNVSLDSLVYGLGSAATGIVSFLLLPVITKQITPGDFGYLSVLTTFQSIVEIVASLGFSATVFRYYGAEQDERQRKTVLSTALIAQGAFMCLVALLVVPFSGFWGAQLLDMQADPRLIAWTALTGLGSAVSVFALSVLRAERNSKAFILIQLVRSLVAAVLTIGLLRVYRQDYTSVILANFIVSMGVGLVLVLKFSLRSSLRSFSWSFFKRSLSFGFPIFIANVFAFFLSLSDRFFLQHYLTPTDVGVYSFGSRMASMLNIGIVAPFSMAVIPYAFSISNKSDFKKVYSRIILYFIYLMGCVSVAIFFLSREVILLLANSKYLDAWTVTGPLLLGTLFYGLYYVVSVGVDLAEKTYLTTFAVVAGGLCSLGLNWLLVPRLGIHGAAFSACLSNIILFLFAYGVNQRAYFIPYEKARILKFLAWLGAFGAISFFKNQLEPPTAVGVALFFPTALLFVSGPVLFGWIDRDERHAFVSWFRSVCDRSARVKR